MNKQELKALRDFARKAHKVFVLLDWTWCADESPTVAEIQEQIMYLLSNLGGQTTKSSCGGLYAEWCEGDEIIEYGMEIYGSCFADKKILQHNDLSKVRKNS